MFYISKKGFDDTINIKTFTDIIVLERVKDGKFSERVFTEEEIQYCESKKTQKYQHYAARFAAKEAVFKAISSGLKNKYDISWKDIEILNDENGRPYVNMINSPINTIENIDI